MANLEEKKPKIVIVGAGPAGLKAALEASKAGYDVTVCEASGTIGGKVQTADLNGKKINICAEFIGKNDEGLLTLAKGYEEKGLLKVVRNEGQSKEIFLDDAGKPVSAETFFASYNVLRDKLSQIKVAMQDPNSPEYKQFHGKSVAEALEYVRATTPVTELSMLGRVWATLTFQTNRVGRDITHIAERAFCQAEVGRFNPKEVDFEQFLGETVPNPGEKQDRFISNGCEYSIEGGTHKLYEAMYEECKAAGVTFKLNTKVESINKNPDGSLQISSMGQDGSEQTLTSDQAVIAVHHKAANRIKGLNKLGLKSGQMLADLNDANMIKFTIETKPGVKLPDVNIYSNKGFQCWLPQEDGCVTFLACKDPKLNSPQLIKQCLESYAQSQGTSVDKIFMPVKGHISFGDPGADNPAYVTLAPGQKEALMRFQREELPILAQNGISMAGAHLPSPDGSVGFMNNAFVSADQAVASLKQNLNQQTTKLRARVHEQNMAMAPMNLPMKPRDGRDNARSTSL